jgi:alkanesulfonate monooxygenase SsuD/methylene tetrahydromethanopterin reductase-like flavin-dependent oxidoreductase (luciferase family)
MHAASAANDHRSAQFMPSPKISVSFDMRAPAFGAPTPTLYAAALEMAAFVDEIGADQIAMMEHHGSEDGYLPQPFVLAAGIAARTKRARLSLGAVILPLHDPVKVAEQIAILDLMSNGRLSVVLGAGYVPSEFAMFGVSLRDRGKLLDKGIEIILRALHGERFEIDGRPIFVRPLPIQAPEDIIMAGGSVPASAKRAARFDIGFGPMRRDLVDLYKQECAALGRAPRRWTGPSPGLPMAIHLSEDPDRGWTLIEPHARHIIKEYAKWAEQGDNANSPFKGLAEDPEALRRSGLFSVWTPDELAAKAPLVLENGSFGFYPLMAGLAPDEGWRSLELLKATMPRLRASV